MNLAIIITIFIVISVLGIIGGVIYTQNQNQTCKASDGFPDTESGKTATKDCPTGSTGSITRKCSDDGAWENPVTNCTQISCKSSDGFPETIGGQTASKSCPTGYTGSVIRKCGSTGVWENAETNCTQIVCQASDGFPETIGGQTATKDCPAGYTGSVIRKCGSTGVWENEEANCSQIVCKSSDGFPETIGGQTAAKYCDSSNKSFGYIYRECNDNGEWGDINDRCVDVTGNMCSINKYKYFSCPNNEAGNFELRCDSNRKFVNEFKYNCVPRKDGAYCNYIYDTIDGIYIPEAPVNTYVNVTHDHVPPYGTDFEPNRDKVTCLADGEWDYAKNDKCQKSLYKPKNLQLGQIMIVFSVDFKRINQQGRIVQLTHHYVYIHDLNTAEEYYRSNVKSAIKREIYEYWSDDYGFWTVQDSSIKIPENLTILHTDEYLLVYTDRFAGIKIMSYDYPYNYINNTIACISSKHEHDVKPIDNYLYLFELNIDKSNYETCINKGLTKKQLYPVSQLYNNNYINLCIITIAFLNNQYISGIGYNFVQPNLEDCSFKLRKQFYKNYYFMVITEKPFCKGIHCFADIKDDVTNMCNGLFNLSSYHFYQIIELNKPYEPSLIYYFDAATNKEYHFSWLVNGDPLITDKNKLLQPYNAAIVTEKYLPKVKCYNI